MTETIKTPHPESDLEPTTDLRTGGPGPVQQASMFQSVTWPLTPLALLSVDLGAVARRFGLTLETSWDERGSLRAAFFVLDGIDFVVTHHEGDAPGTHVWTRKGGPVGSPATRVGSLLTALGVGPEAVAYSTWGTGTDLSHVPTAWSHARERPTWSRQDVWAHFKARPGIFAGRTTYEAVVGFLNGYDAAADNALLDGIGQWLAARLGYGGNLVYWHLAEKLIFPEGSPEKPWSPETEQHAVTELLGLVDEFFDHVADDPADRAGTL